MPWLRSKRLVEGRMRGFLPRHWQRWLRVRWRVRFSEDAFNLLMAAGVGVIGGLVNIFYYATELVRVLFFAAAGRIGRGGGTHGALAAGGHADPGRIVRGAGALLGFARVGPQRSSNLLEVIVAGDGRLPLRTGLVKFLSSLVTIGSGGSDWPGGGDYATVGDVCLQMGAIDEVASVSAAAAGGLWSHLGDCGGLQRPDLRGGVCGADCDGELLDEPACAAGLRVGGGNYGVAQLLRHRALVVCRPTY